MTRHVLAVESSFCCLLISEYTYGVLNTAHTMAEFRRFFFVDGEGVDLMPACLHTVLQNTNSLYLNREFDGLHETIFLKPCRDKNGLHVFVPSRSATPLEVHAVRHCMCSSRQGL
jgi:hypothetical protein